jgi:homogentisate 1,2-dioxygenase
LCWQLRKAELKITTIKNTDADEMIFVHEGSGTVYLQYGELPFGYGDYIVLPRGTIYQIEFNDDKNRLFIVESFTPLRSPKYMSRLWAIDGTFALLRKRYSSSTGSETYDLKGDYLIKAKKRGMMYGLHYGTHPLMSLVGMVVAILIFSIHDFEPITGRVHQPPPVHQTFGDECICSLLVCATVIRLSSAGNSCAVQSQQYRQR